MRVTLNLASHPYLELGPLYTRLRALIVLLVILPFPLWLLLRSESRKAVQAESRLVAVEHRVQALQQEQQSFQSEMQQPPNAAVLKQSRFLNQLFERKAFSWTAVMMDLENVLPGGVQVLNIDPVIAPDGNVTIRLRVSGQRDRVVDFVRNLEHSHRFLSPRLADEAAETTQSGRGVQPVSTGADVDFDILAEYNPLPEAAETKKVAKAAPASAAKRPRTKRGTAAHSGPRAAAPKKAVAP